MTKSVSSGFHLPQQRADERSTLNISFVVWNSQHNRWIVPSLTPQTQQKYESVLKTSEVFKNAKPGEVLYIGPKGKVFKEAEIKGRNTFKDITPKKQQEAISQIGKETFIEAKIPKNVLKTKPPAWEFLKQLPFLIGRISSFFMSWSLQAQTATRVEVKQLHEYFNEHTDHMTEFDKHFLKNCRGLGISEEKLKLFLEANDNLKATYIKIQAELSKQDVSWNKKSAVEFLPVLKDEIVNYLKVAGELLPYNESLKGKRIYIDEIASFHKNFYEFILQKIEEEGVEGDWSASLEEIKKATVQFNLRVRFHEEINNTVKFEKEFLKRLELIRTLMADHASELLQALKAEGLSNIEITAFLSPIAKATVVSQGLLTRLQKIQTLVKEERYDEAMEAYQKLAKDDLPQYREDLRDLVLSEKLMTIRKNEGQIQDPFTQGINRLLISLREQNKGIPEWNLAQFDMSAESHIGKVLDNYQSITSIYPKTKYPEVTFTDDVDNFVKSQKDILNSSLIDASNLVDQVSVAGMLKIDKSLQGKWRDKLQSKGWYGLEINKLDILYRNYGKVVAPLYLARQAYILNPGNSIIRNELQKVWLSYQRDIKRLESDIEKLGGVEQLGMLSDAYQEFVQENPNAKNSTDFRDFGELTLQRYRFLKDIEQELGIAPHPLQENLLKPSFRDDKTLYQSWETLLIKHGWARWNPKKGSEKLSFNENKILKFEKLYSDYNKIVQELQYKKALYKKGELSYESLKSFANKRSSQIMKLQKQFRDEFGGAEGVMQLSHAIDEMQDRLLEKLLYEKDIPSQRILRSSLDQIEKGRVDRQFKEHHSFLDSLYKEFNLRNFVVEENINALGEIDGWSENQTKTLNNLYQKYTKLIEPLLLLDKKLKQTADKKLISKKLNQEYERKKTELSRLRAEMTPLVDTLSSAISNKRLALEARLVEMQNQIKQVPDYNTIISDEDKRGYSALVKEQRDLQYEIQNIQDQIDDLDNADFKKNIIKMKAFEERLSDQFKYSEKA